MLINFLFLIFFLVLMILILFFLVSKNFKFDMLMSSTFECGYTSYFFSRFSFSMHYFLVGLIFLFLDLELCYLFPFFNEDFSSFMIYGYLWFFMLVLLMGLLEEWSEGLLDWKF